MSDFFEAVYAIYLLLFGWMPPALAAFAIFIIAAIVIILIIKLVALILDAIPFL